MEQQNQPQEPTHYVVTGVDLDALFERIASLPVSWKVANPIIQHINNTFKPTKVVAKPDPSGVQDTPEVNNS